MAKDSHIARKVAWALAAGGVRRTDLTSAFGISTSAISEWKRTGRIEKERLPLLAKLSGTRLAWWLDADAPVPPTTEWLDTAGTRSASAQFADGFAESVASPDRPAEMSPAEARVILALRGLSPAQQRAVIEHIEKIATENREIVAALSTREIAPPAYGDSPQRRARPPLMPYPEPFARKNKGPAAAPAKRPKRVG
jgi:hypothetical protein